MFMSDLIKKIEFNSELSFVKLASYEGTQTHGRREVPHRTQPVARRAPRDYRRGHRRHGRVDRADDRDLENLHPATIAVCTLFFKPGSYRKQLPINYRAMEIGNEFIVGYGLDYNQLGRSLKDIYVVTE